MIAVMTLQNHGLALRMAELARVIALRPVDDVLVDVTTAAKELIPGVDVAGVLLVGTDGTHETLAPTSDLMFKLDDLQMNTGEGPCLEATRVGGTTTVPEPRVISPSRDLRRCELSHAMSSSICLKLVSFFQNAATDPWATYPIAAGRGPSIQKVPSRDGYPRGNSGIVQSRWEMNGPAAAPCIGYYLPWRVSQYPRTRCAVPIADRPAAA